MERILIIDDEKQVTDTLSDALKPLPFEVFVSQDPIEGLRMFRDLNPFLLILDINMQPIDGLEIVKQLIKQEVPKHTNANHMEELPVTGDSSNRTLKEANFYVVILTGYGSQNLMKQCRELGVEFFLHKPVHINILRNVINSIHKLKTKRDELNE